MTEPPRDAAPPARGADDSIEEPRGAGRLIARFFLLPLLVVGAAVGVFLVFNLMTFERRSPRDYLQEVRGGTANRRWQAAFELSRSLPNLPPEERAALTAETLRIFEGLSPASGRKTFRCAVTSCWSWDGSASPAAFPPLQAAAVDPDPDTRLYAVWALGKIGDTAGRSPTVLDGVAFRGRRRAARWRRTFSAQLGDPRAIPRFQVLAEDKVADVRWNAAIALAELGDASGLPVLRSMIDRSALARQAPQLSSDQAEAAMVNALKAIDTFEGRRRRCPRSRKLAKEDPNLRVRDAARRAADAARGEGAKP